MTIFKTTPLMFTLALLGVGACDAGSVPPVAAVDSDGDGVADADDAFPNDPNETKDTDGDGIGDNADPFPETAGCPAGYDDINSDGSACRDIDECAGNPCDDVGM